MRRRSNYLPLRTQRTRRSLRVFLSVLSVLCGGVFVTVASAQFQMPDPKQMAGIPRPVTDLPDGSISVRLIRGQLSNNISSHLVELHFANGRVLKVNTDDAGRAQFDKVPAGERVKATADVDGEHASMYAGVGLVEGSRPGSELEETQLKLQALLAALVRP